MYKKKFSVHEPDLSSDDFQAVLNVLKKKEISGSSTDTILKFEKNFAKYCKTKFSVAVSNGTSAIHLACMAIGIKNGDEVLVSSSTNIAAALGIYYCGGIPVPIDSSPHTWNLDEELIKKNITNKTKAILVVHFLGLPVDMRKILKIARNYRLKVIEDCAEAHGAKLDRKIVGSFGDISCFSFYSNKIVTTGEGGMVLTNNKNYYKKVKLLKNVAFGIPRFFHKIPGYNYRMGSLQAALGLSQLKKINKFIEKKRRVANLYFRYLSGIDEIQLPYRNKRFYNVYWMYGIRLINSKKRNKLMNFLSLKGIETRTFFCSLTLQPFLRKIKNYKKYNCPVSELMWKDGLYLPSSNNLTKKEIKYIARQVKIFFKS